MAIIRYDPAYRGMGLGTQLAQGVSDGFAQAARVMLERKLRQKEADEELERRKTMETFRTDENVRQAKKLFEFETDPVTVENRIEAQRPLMELEEDFQIAAEQRQHVNEMARIRETEKIRGEQPFREFEAAMKFIQERFTDPRTGQLTPQGQDALEIAAMKSVGAPAGVLTDYIQRKHAAEGTGDDEDLDQSFEKETVERDGIRYGRDRYGRWMKISDPPRTTTGGSGSRPLMTFNDFSAIWDETESLMTQTIKGQAGEVTERKPDADAVRRRIEDKVKMYRELMGVPASDPPSPPPPAPRPGGAPPPAGSPMGTGGDPGMMGAPSGGEQQITSDDVDRYIDFVRTQFPDPEDIPPQVRAWVEQMINLVEPDNAETSQ